MQEYLCVFILVKLDSRFILPMCLVRPTLLSLQLHPAQPGQLQGNGQPRESTH